MKKGKRILSGILCFLLLFTQVAFAAQTGNTTGAAISLYQQEEEQNDVQEDGGLLFSLMTALNKNTRWYDADKDEFTLTTANELRGLAELVNDPENSISFKGVTIYLGADIDLSDGNWVPIGSSESCAFAGTFDGQGHTISHMNVTGDSNHRGLFGYTKSGATIRNLLLEGTVSGASSVGGLVGTAVKTTVENCGVTVDITASGDSGSCGGIIGSADAKTKVQNCFVKGGLADAGNVINAQAVVKNCYFLIGEEEVAADGVTGLTAEDFVSGRAAYLLDGGDGSRQKAWSQGDVGPVLADEEHLPIYRLIMEEGTDPVNGTITAPEYVMAGEEAVFTAEAEEGYLLKRLTVTFENGEKTVDSGTSPKTVMPQSDGIWNAVFAEIPEESSFIATFHTEIGTLSDSQVTVEAGAKLREATPSIDRELNDIYRFEGWYTDSELTREYDFGEAVTTDLELYAKWDDAFTQGTEADPYVITTEAELRELANRVNGGTSYSGCWFTLGRDMELSESWTSIGTEEHPFEGSFDGRGYGLSNLSGALFGSIKGSTISHLKLQGTVSDSGALAKKAENATVEYIFSEAIVTADGGAGLIGAADEGTLVRGAFVNAPLGNNNAISNGGTADHCGFTAGMASAQAGVREFDQRALTSGEAAWYLDSTESGSRALLWGQGEATPIFAQQDAQLVYRITGKADGKGKMIPDREYAFAGETVTLTNEPGANGSIQYVLRKAVVTSVEGDVVCIDSGKNITFEMPACDVTAEGDFVERTANKFAVTFEGNGGTLMGGASMIEIMVEAGEKAVPQTIERVGDDGEAYIFTGWYADRQCLRAYDFNVAVTSSFTLYGGWRSADSVQVTFDLNGGIGSVDTQIVLKGDTVAEPAAPSRVSDEEGKVWKFQGWFTEPEGGTPWNFQEDAISVETDSEMTLYAQWELVDRFESGTADAPYVIETAAQLKALAETVNGGNDMEGCYFALGGNIDLKTIENWTPIGTETMPFRGHFDGCGYTVQNLSVTAKKAGLFGAVESATISNITVTGDIEGGQTAGSVAAISSDTVFENCINEAAVSGQTAGGIAGLDQGNTSTFLNCENRGTVSGSLMAGGITGKVEASNGTSAAPLYVNFTACLNEGSVTSAQGRAGGILGYGEIQQYSAVHFTDCENRTTVLGDNGVGGIAGGMKSIYVNNAPMKWPVISGCKNIGEIRGEEAVGGIIGCYDGVEPALTYYYPGAKMEMKLCSNAGAISAQRYAGGLVGRLAGPRAANSNNINNSYNLGTVSAAESNAGGIIGYNVTRYNNIKSDYFIGVYNAGEVTAASEAGNIVGVTNALYGTKTTRCFALEQMVDGAVDTNLPYATVTAERMESPEFAFTLDAGQKIWTQGTPGPVFADEEQPCIFQLTLGTVTGTEVTGLSEGGYYRAGAPVRLGLNMSEGYILKLYTVRVSGTTVLSGSGTVSFTMPEGNAVLNVTCVERTADEFTVTLHGNGGLMNGRETAEQTVAAGEKVTRPLITRASEGTTTYELLGWYTDEALTEPYDFNTGVTENMDLYAAWTITSAFTVRFDINATDPTATPAQIDDVQTYRGELIVRPEQPQWPDRSDETHRFLGWAPVRDASEDQYWNFEKDKISPLIEEDSLTLYAQWDVDDKFASGSETNPFVIQDEETLGWLAYKVNRGKSYEGCYFTLETDIALENSWTPIGTAAAPFSGTFDGNEKAISKLQFAASSQYQGFFGYVKDGAIIDLIIGDESGEETLTMSATSACGTIVGAANGAVTVEGCINRTNITVTSSVNAGGIVGTSISGTSGLVIRDCKNQGTINAKEESGGIIANSQSSALSLISCENSGNITTTNKYIGGIGGNIVQARCIIDCYNSGNISTSNSYAGGIVGSIGGVVDAGSAISGNVNCGTVKAKNYAGGVFGQLNGSFIENISRCVNEGAVTSSGTYAGGIAAYVKVATTIHDCLNTAEVKTSSNTATTYIGGIAGGMDTSFAGTGTQVPTARQTVSVRNCVNTGSVIAGGDTAKVGAILPVYYTKNTGNYALKADLADADYVTAATAEELASGEIAWALNHTDTASRPVWGQRGDVPYPAVDGVTPIFKVELTPAQNGAIGTERTYVSAGERVQLTITPAEGYLLKTLKASEADGSDVRIVLGSGSQASFSMPENDVAVEASFVESSAITGRSFVVTFDSQGGSAVAAKTVEGGQRVEEPADPIREGFVFAGWYLAGEPFDFNTAITENVTLEAQWKSESDAVVTFQLNRPAADSGSAAPADQTVRIGALLSKPSDPEWTGSDGTEYEFLGWYTQKNGGERWDFETDTVTGDMTLYARWISGDPFLSGTSEQDPYVISSAETLKKLAEAVNKGNTYEGYYFQLGNDIDLGDLDGLWEGIGSQKPEYSQQTSALDSNSVPFNGTLDGADHTITLQPEQLKSIFNCIGYSGTVKNLFVEGDLEPNTSRGGFGGVAAYSWGTIDNCHTDINCADAEVPGFGLQIGGIVGRNVGTVSNCTTLFKAYVQTSAQAMFGGITGFTVDGRVENCIVKSGSKLVLSGASIARMGGIAGAVKANAGVTEVGIYNCQTEPGVILECMDGDAIGGLVGYGGGQMLQHSPVNVVFCINNATVINHGGHAAGVCGVPSGVHVKNTWNGGSITAKTEASGFGTSNSNYLINGVSVVENFYNVGDTIAEEGPAYGIAPQMAGTIRNSYFYGKLSGAEGQEYAVTSKAGAIENTWYLVKESNGEVTGVGGASEATEAVMTSGELAYKLNGEDEPQNAWIQGEEYPIFGENGIYKVTCEVTGRTEGGSISLSPNQKYINGGANVSVSVETNDTDDLHYVYTLVAVQGGSRENITESKSVTVEGDTNIIARFQLEEEVFEEEPLPTPPPGDGGGSGGGNGGHGAGSNTGTGTGAGTEPGTEGSGQQPGTGPEEGSGSGTTDGETTNPPATNPPVIVVPVPDAEDRPIVVTEPTPVSEEVSMPTEESNPEDEPTEEVMSGNLEAGGQEGGTDDEEENVTVFEIIRKTVQENPLLTVIVSVAIVGILAASVLHGWARNKKAK